MHESQPKVRDEETLSLNFIRLGHVLLLFMALIAYPPWIWSQFAMAGFWLALGKGPMWSRLLWILSGFLLLGIVMANPLNPSEAFPSALWTIVFTCLFSGMGVVVLGQNPAWMLLRVQFRIWELIVGTACLGFGFYFVKEVGHVESIPRSHLKTICFILINAGLLGLGTAAIGMILMTRRGLPRLVVRTVAALITLLVPAIDYLACELLKIDPYSIENRVFFYLSNLAIVWVTVLLYEQAINLGERMIIKTSSEAGSQK